jgi:hypothetical protein
VPKWNFYEESPRAPPVFDCLPKASVEITFATLAAMLRLACAWAQISSHPIHADKDCVDQRERIPNAWLSLAQTRLRQGSQDSRWVGPTAVPEASQASHDPLINLVHLAKMRAVARSAPRRNRYSKPRYPADRALSLLIRPAQKAVARSVARRRHRGVACGGGEYLYSFEGQAFLCVRMREDFANFIGRGTLRWDAPDGSDHGAEFSRRDILAAPKFAPAALEMLSSIKCRRNRLRPLPDRPGASTRARPHPSIPRSRAVSTRRGIAISAIVTPLPILT